MSEEHEVLSNPIVTSVDPITFEILSHRVYQIAKEMGTTLERVGGTVNTTQMHDYMAALYLANGEVLCAGDAMGWHVACAGVAVKRIIERFEKDGGIHPGDIFLLNDPYVAAITNRMSMWFRRSISKAN
jgi:N-methylhydantoinase B